MKTGDMCEQCRADVAHPGHDLCEGCIADRQAERELTASLAARVTAEHEAEVISRDERVVA